MRIGKYVKDPDERKRYRIDYDEWLDTGESITIAAFTVPDNSATSPLVIDGDEIEVGARGVQFYVSDGEHGRDYVVLVTITTHLGQVKEDTILFNIRSS